jgi:hypothetical protein
MRARGAFLSQMLTLAIFGISSSGCSFLFTTKAPAEPERLPPDAPLQCTSERVAPILDTVFAALGVLRTGIAVSAHKNDYDDTPLSKGADVGISVGLTTLLTASAVYGFGVTSRCEQAKESRAASPPTVPSAAPPVQ